MNAVAIDAMTDFDHVGQLSPVLFESSWADSCQV